MTESVVYCASYHAIDCSSFTSVRELVSCNTDLTALRKLNKSKVAASEIVTKWRPVIGFPTDAKQGNRETSPLAFKL